MNSNLNLLVNKTKTEMLSQNFHLFQYKSNAAILYLPKITKISI